MTKVDPVQAHLDSYQGDHAGLVAHMIGEHPQLYDEWAAGDPFAHVNDQHHVAHGKLTSAAELAEDMRRDRGGRL